ncbi:conserved transmembrane rich in alanine and arginine and proline domain protein [Mycobacterium xenopi 3993]|nr:conserved transmembrane rich in alanine and arginine and proline domain protein [Mycobacterium xenopi 3993]
MTALLVLAIGASSALVFTNRVELLKLAVILALWPPSWRPSCR